MTARAESSGEGRSLDRPILFSVGWKDVEPSGSVEAADWIAPRLHPFAQDVGSVVPTGFEAYARIFHPAGKSPDHRPGDPVRSAVDIRWSEIATSAGRIVHPEMQFHAIAAPISDRADAPVKWDEVPRDGTLSARPLLALVEILTAHTTTPGACWMCLWEGYGYNTAVWMTAVDEPTPRRRLMAWFRRLRFGSRSRRHFPASPDRVPQPDIDPVWWDRVSGPPRFAELLEKAKRVRLPARDYLLFDGSIDHAKGWGDGPNLWWPDDRAWCVASEIDFAYTYVGGSKELIEEILVHPDLEALPTTINDGITHDSDRVNS